MNEKQRRALECLDGWGWLDASASGLEGVGAELEVLGYAKRHTSWIGMGNYYKDQYEITAAGRAVLIRGTDTKEKA